MLQKQLIFICLFVLFVGNLAQQLRSNVQNWNEDRYDKLSYRQRRQVQPSQSETRQSVNTVNQQKVVQPGSSNQISSTSSVSSMSLANSPECKADIRKYCIKSGSKLIVNLKVLQCIDDLDNAVNLINKECQNKIYKYKYNMTHNVHFDDAAMKFCAKDIKLLEDCNDHTDELGTGRLISCLYDLLSNITEPTCTNFIKQIHSAVFTDWRLSETFATACLSDITQLKCGRLDDDNETLPHDQGAVISCLSKSPDTLSKNCLKHISRLAEMQSDDYHLDRALYYACREDRERLCSQVASGNGRVYRCLYEQKFNNMMTQACREEVHRRQKMVASNALLDAPLIRACNSEMREHQCVANPQDRDKQLSLVNLLLCLENRLKTGNQINDECRRQMLIHRRMLMSDYVLSTEIMSECKTEMTQHCPSLYQKGASGTIDQRGGRMIHCLLNAARKESSFSPACLSNIKLLVRAIDPGSDIRADPLLETTCRPVIDALCSRVKPGESNVIMCLLDNIKNTRMSEECEDRLMEVSYFMVRDWRLTPNLLRSCRKNLGNFCQLPQNWTMSKEMSDVQVGEYLSCLYLQKPQLDSECRSELKRLMRIRSQSIGLMPEIEDNCIIDLAVCKNREVKGEEIKCLQKTYKDLEDKCKIAVQKFTKMTISDPTLDFPLMKACEPMIPLFCSNVENGNENDLLPCLIKHKNIQKMDYRCKAAIEHHQIISLKDEEFLSDQFRKKCSLEVSQHCPEKKTKAMVIQCLADKMLRDVLKRQNEITEDCRDGLKFELLQRSESIDFDPSLAEACQNDIRQFCGDRTAGNAEILDCLKDNRNKVSVRCYNKLKRREKLDVIAPENDYSLMSKCATVIQKTCSNENKQNILSCLRHNINSDFMTNACRRVLYHRLIILNSNARFNKGLIENCQVDINKHCKLEIIDSDDDDDKDDDDEKNNQGNENNNNVINDHAMGGRVIQCLRAKYVDSSVTLESQCVTELIDVIQTSKLNVKLDFRLYQTCRKYLTDKCTGIDQEDCLKLMYQKNQISDDDCRAQVKRVIREERVYLNADHALFFACRIDILKFCNDIPIGNGKQLQCLLSTRDLASNQCKNMLSKREELWNSVLNESDLMNAIDNTLKEHISYSTIFPYVTYCVIFVMLVLMFMAGYIYREDSEYNRNIDYKC